jgi:hypothetical protein
MPGHACAPCDVRGDQREEDLILSKLHWAKDSRSEFQLANVRNLIASVDTLDWSYLDRWAPDLSVAALLAELRS